MKSPPECEPSTHPHLVAYKNIIPQLKINLKKNPIYKKRETDLQRTMTCTLTPFSLSCLLLELELKSPDRRSLADLSVDRGVCDGDGDGETIPPPLLLCCDEEEESISPLFNYKTFSADSPQQFTKSARPPDQLSLSVSILLFIKQKKKRERINSASESDYYYSINLSIDKNLHVQL